MMRSEGRLELNASHYEGVLNGAYYPPSTPDEPMNARLFSTGSPNRGVLQIQAANEGWGAEPDEDEEVEQSSVWLQVNLQFQMMGNVRMSFGRYVLKEEGMADRRGRGQVSILKDDTWTVVL
eukprot:Sspe_Gene.65136::Locus_38571_Transcript_1_1_Confidence_1.000_Length_367::g.65136::m.65136